MMKRQFLAFLMLCLGMTALAQQMQKYEYWLDQGHADRIVGTTGTNELNLDVDVSNIHHGVHTLNFRAQDSDGKWSAPSTSYFFCIANSPASHGVSLYEYWLDKDFATKTVTNNSSSSVTVDVDVTKLGLGLHSFSFRCKDEYGKWSVPQTNLFFVPDYQKGSEVRSTYEYWIDTKASEKVQVKGYSNVVNLDLDLNTLSSGLHTFSFRASDKDGRWSAPQTSLFFIAGRKDVSEVKNTYEYWIDDNTGNKVQVEGYDKMVNLSLDVNHLTSGLHTISFRTSDKNGRWTAPQTSYFLVTTGKKGKQDIKAYRYWFNNAVDNSITEAVSPAVIPFTLDTKLTASDIVTDITPETITMTDDGEGHMKLATKNVLHTQYCTADGRWTAVTADTFAVVVNAKDVDLTGFVKNPVASDKWNGWKTEGNTIGIQNTKAWEEGSNYFRLGNTSKAEWTSSMEQTITGLPAGTYVLSAKGRAAEGVDMEVSANGFAEVFTATGTEGGELGNGWNERSFIFTTDGLPFVIKVSGTAKSSGKWMDVSDFRLTYSNASNASLSVSMPESVNMQQYKNLKLQLISVSSKLSVTTSANKEYTFQGLTAGVSYDLMLTNRYGQIVASKKGITIEEGENEVALSDLASLCNAEAAVLGSDQTNLADKSHVTWLLADSMVIAEESKVTGLLCDTKLLCNVSLGDSLGCLYHEVKGQECQLKSGNNTININLVPIEKATVTGKVLTDNGGMSLRANVSITALLNGKYAKTLAVRADTKGAFTSDCHQDSLHIVVSSDGYLDCVIDTLCNASMLDLGTLRMKEITGIVVTPRLNYTSATEDDTESSLVYTDTENIDYTVKNLSTNSALDDVTVQSGNIIIKSGAAVGDRLSITVHSRKDEFTDVTIESIVADDETVYAAFALTEKGGIKATYEFSGNNDNIAMLYDASGSLVSRLFYDGGKCTFTHLADGHYTLLSMGKTMMLDAILNISDLQAIGLTEGTDYVLSEIDVKEGQITLVNNEVIPTIDETLFYYTGTNTSFTANKNSVVVGNYITLTGRLDFKEEYAADVDNLSLVVDLPEGMEYVKGSAIIGTTLAPCSVDGDRLTISLNRSNYQERIRFCVVPTKGGSMMPSAYVAFSLDKDIVQPIGSASITAKDMSISVPATVAKTDISVSGVAVPYSKVTVYDGSTTIGQITAKADGNWMTNVELVKAYDLSTHSIYANVVTPQEINMNTEVVDVLYDKNAIEVKTVTMIYRGNNIVFDFKNQSVNKSSYSFNPSYPNFTFVINLTNNDTTLVKDIMLNVFTKNGKTVSLYPIYDSNINAFVTSGIFNSYALPINVSVDFVINRNHVITTDYINDLFELIQEEKVNYYAERQRGEELLDELEKYNIEGDVEEYINSGKFDEYMCFIDVINGEQVEINEELLQELLRLSPEDLISQLDSDLQWTDKLLEEKELETKELDSVFDKEGVFYNYSIPFNDGSLTVKLISAPCEYGTASELRQAGYKELPTDGKAILFERYSDEGYEYVDLSHNVHWSTLIFSNANNSSKSRSKSDSNTYGWMDLGSDLYKGVFTNGDFVEQLWSSTASKEMNFTKLFYDDLISKNKTNLRALKESQKTIESNLGKDFYKKALQGRQESIKKIEKLQKKELSGLNFNKNLANAVGYLNLAKDSYEIGDKIKKLKDGLDVSVPGCVYLKNPQIAEQLDKEMLKLNQDADFWGGLQYLRTGVWALAEGFATPVGGLAISLIQGYTESQREEKKKIEISSRAAMLRAKILQAVKQYCTEDEARKFANDTYGAPKKMSPFDLSPVVDPSGYVYEAVSSNRLEGVTATIYQKVTTEDMYGDKHDNVVKWDAEPYSQKNPVKTDINGLYAWDVPNGLWQVKFEKEGYETVYSEWLPVPPPQLDINVPMYQSVQPEVIDARGFESGVDFTFSKYMRPETFEDGCVTLTHDGKQLVGHLTMLDIEKEPLDGIEYASHIKFVPEQSLHVGDIVTLTVSSKVKSYCGVVMEKDYTTTLVIQPEIKEIVVNPVVNVNYGSRSEIVVSVLPADAAKGKKLKIENGTPSIINTEGSELVLDEHGAAMIPVIGALPGTGALRLSVENCDATAEIMVNVVVPSNEISAPEASIPSGSTVAKGTIVILSCLTDGATIYYTLDGSCPCDEATRFVYTEPIVINETLTIKAMAVASDMTESEIVEFTYIVEEGDGIDDVTIDENLKIYPLPVRDKLNITAGGKVVKSVTLVSTSGSTVVSASKPATHVTIDVSNLTSGIYIINVWTEDKTYSRKIMKVE